ncbi:MAG TPA: hypothetical protein VLB44_17965 [Kofleriaceae bacterium]|nr:hypothetical protein [Kofleriaceae bacterium]
MGKGDDKKARQTRELDPWALAALTIDAAEPMTESEAVEETTPPVTLGRTKTLDDPMTTGLLAEVARRSRTVDFDKEVIEILLDSIDQQDTSQPHLKRRKT